MFTSIAAAPINHVLHRESWAHKRLQRCAGKIVRIRVFPLIDLTFAIQADGQVSNVPNSTTADASISLSLGMLPLLLAKDEDIYNTLKISGDNAIAKELIEIGKHLRWDITQDLSKIIGDMPAHRIAQAGEALVQWHNKSINNLSQTLAEYWVEEQPVLAKSLHINNFIKEVNTLHEDTNALEKRLYNLTNRALSCTDRNPYNQPKNSLHR